MKMCTLMILALVLPAYSQPVDGTASLLQITKKTEEEKSHQVQSQKIEAETSHQIQSQKSGAEKTHQLQSKENETLVTAQKSAQKSKPLKKQDPDTSGDADAGTGTLGSNLPRIVYQLIFGALYYFLVVTKYPYPMKEPLNMPKKAIALQDMDPVSATFEVSLSNCFLSYCCSGPRAAHTFYGTDIAGYWASLICMSIFPCCVLFAANTCTDLNEKLGGQKQNILMAALCSFCCSCCLIAQDAETLDVINGVQTGFCGVTDAPNV